MAVVITGNNTPTAGGVTYGDGTTYATTTAGTAGYLLQSNGAAAPSWVAASSGAMTLLSTVTASASATVDVETGFGATYDSYMILGTGLVPSSTSAGGLSFRLKLGGTYQTSGYAGYVIQPGSSSNAYDGGSYTGSAGPVTLNFGSPASGTGAALNFTMWVQDVNSTSNAKGAYSTGLSFTEGTNTVRLTTSGAMINNVTTALTGVRFFAQSGNITSGTFRLYGISKS